MSLNLKDIACRPLESQPTTMEKEIATNVTRLMYQSKIPLLNFLQEEQLVKLTYTHYKHITHYIKFHIAFKLSSSIIPSGECSRQTMRRRSNELLEIREKLFKVFK